VLRFLLKGKLIRLFSNNPIKKAQLEAGGQPVENMVPYVVGLPTVMDPTVMDPTVMDLETLKIFLSRTRQPCLAPSSSAR
jgi:hypothetical protein